MSTFELREKLRVLTSAERREMMVVLKELEEAEAPEPAAKDAKRSFEAAMDYTFQNFDNALRKLAQ
jgi:hypothetical protein